MEFKNTIGHEKQKSLLLRALANNRLAHAYALIGESHLGKTTFALDFAEILGVDPRWEVFLADSADAFSVEQARELQKHLSLGAAGKYRVAVVAGAESMTPEAANALLKLLEEPPTRSVIFLITDNLYKLLPTVVSRVQKVHFGKISDEEVTLAVSAFPLAKEIKTQIVSLARGRAGWARRLAESREELAFSESTQGHFQKLVSGTVPERLASAEQVAKLETPEVEKCLRMLMELWTISPQPKPLGEKLLGAWRDFQANVNLRLLLDNLFLP